MQTNLLSNSETRTYWFTFQLFSLKKLIGFTDFGNRRQKIEKKFNFEMAPSLSLDQKKPDLLFCNFFSSSSQKKKSPNICRTSLHQSKLENIIRLEDFRRCGTKSWKRLIRVRKDLLEELMFEQKVAANFCCRWSQGSSRSCHLEPEIFIFIA